MRRSQPETRERYVRGLRLGAGPGLVVFVIGLSFGATARMAGWGVLAPTVSSALTFSGSAQFTLLTALTSGSAVAAVVAATLINARYLVMSLALNDSLRGSRLTRSLQAQALCDASFVGAHLGGGRFDPLVLLGASTPQWVGWVSGTFLGAAAGLPPELAHRLGVDVAFPAFFALLALADVRRSSTGGRVITVAAILTVVGLQVLDAGTAVLLASTAVLAGMKRPPTTREGP
jgi:predicted branched-subunit amino acid permease